LSGKDNTLHLVNLVIHPVLNLAKRLVNIVEYFLTLVLLLILFGLEDNEELFLGLVVIDYEAEVRHYSQFVLKTRLVLGLANLSLSHCHDTNNHVKEYDVESKSGGNEDNPKNLTLVNVVIVVANCLKLTQRQQVHAEEDVQNLVIEMLVNQHVFIVFVL
jgi:hypothetical protein